MPTRTPIEQWTVQPTSSTPHDIPRPLPATVPGCVHTDLMAAGILPDVRLGQNERTQHWVGQANWRYTAPLPVPEGGHDRVDLVCMGLDTVAEVRVGSQHVGSVENMHRSYRFDVTSLMDQETVEVDFTSAVHEAARRNLAGGHRPHTFDQPFNALRKMACSFGWDWGPDTATCGIWKPIALEGWSVARLDQVLTEARPVGEGGQVRVTLTVERTRPEPLSVRATLQGGSSQQVELAAEQDQAILTLDIEDVELWWPVGHGDQRLYQVSVELRHGQQILDSTTRRVGFRTTSIVTQPDDDGTSFVLQVNGKPVYVHGVNWIPDDLFPHLVDRARYQERLGQALFAHCNLVRIWGGGLYEADDFYELCDEMGLLVWQDFPFACAAYAEDEPLRDEVEAEARENVARLAHHPSLVVLNGNNENLWGYRDWRWQEQLVDESWGAGYYHDLLPRVCEELAPGVTYTPGSPWTPTEGLPDDARVNANDPSHGSCHLWDMWNDRPWSGYRTHRPRFVAEFGWQGAPTWTTMAEFGDDPLAPESPGTRLHQKAVDGNMKLSTGLVSELRMPRTIEQWHWATQWAQAVAVRTAITWFRSLHPLCTGNIVWQLNDCWPSISWAAVDSHGRAKPLLHALRLAQAERLVTIQPSGLGDGGLRIAAHNDTDQQWESVATVRRIDLTGEVLADHEVALCLPARSAQSVDVPGELLTDVDPAHEVLVVEIDGLRDHWWFAPARDTALRVPSFDVTVDGGRVTVTPDKFVRDMALLVDKASADATVDSMLVTLLPGESHTFFVDETLSAGAVREALVSVNDLVAAGSARQAPEPEA